MLDEEKRMLQEMLMQSMVISSDIGDVNKKIAELDEKNNEFVAKLQNKLSS